MIDFNKRFFLVRHGETQYNKDHIIQGYIDSPLTDIGLAQAKEAAKKAKELNIDILVSSDLERAVKTAGIISDEIGIPITKSDPVFRERNFGDLEGKKGDEIRNDYPQYVAENGLLILEHDFPTAEPINDFYNRIINGISSLVKEYADKNILLVGHKGVLNMMYAYANSIPLDKIRTVYDAKNCLIENY